MRKGRVRRAWSARSVAATTVVLIVLLTTPGAADAATPSGASLSPDAQGRGSVGWTGLVSPGTATASVSEACFGVDDKPDPAAGCDFFALDVSVPDRFYEGFLGGVEVSIENFGLSDIDLAVYRRDPDGTRGAAVGGSASLPGQAEQTVISAPQGSYYVVAVPYTVLPGQAYRATARFDLTRAALPLPELNAKPPPGLPNYRASHDRYISHSEPTIAMDPLDHDHLVGASKMYEDLSKYFFKIGTYESFDGGRSWRDYGHLPGYCATPGQCDPANDAEYRLTSDVSLAFDDEGNAYANVLDAPGGVASMGGWNMSVHIKRPGQDWSGPIVAHDNRREPVSNALLLDDKNWIAVDNSTDVNGGPNRPRDGKIGTMYLCWSLDFPVVGQEIVLMRSVNGGRTWGGFAPGDNLPQPLSKRGVLSGIGCHISVGPRGEVYVTWYDYFLDVLMQVKSTDRGRTFSLPHAIARISGVNQQFERESFRNLSIPATAVDRSGTVYVVAASCRGEGSPLTRAAGDLERLIKERDLRDLRADDAVAACGGTEPTSDRGSGADIVLFKSTDGGAHYTGPIRVNQDGAGSGADQFQPWIAVTDRGQVDISYFDRRRDPSNFFIDTYLSRSNDGGRTFHDTRVSERSWDARVNPPISPSGEFIGDYQGLVADDEVAIPFWNDTQLATLPKTDKRYSPYQEVFAARVPNGASRGGPRPRCFPRRVNVHRRSIGRLSVGARRTTVVRRLGLPSRQRGRVWRYCVRGGGRVLAVFSRRKRVLLAASTARGHRALGVARGSSARRLHSRFGPRLTELRRGLFRVRAGSGRGIVFAVRRGRVSYVAVADRSLLGKRGRLPGELRRAGLLRGRLQ